MANIAGILGNVRRILGALTDLLLKGRQAGLWQQGPGYIPPEKPLQFPPEKR